MVVSTREPSHHRRYETLDGMRGIAAFVVMIYHFTQAQTQCLQNAYLAVDFFFMLSGFVIAYSYEDKIASGMGWGKFMKVRLIRLYPLMVAGVIAGGAYVMLRGHAEPWRAISRNDLLTAIIFGLLLIPMFSPQAPLPSLNGASWSLFFEIFVNAVYGLLCRRLNDRMLGATVLVSGARLALLAAFSSWIGGADRLHYLLGVPPLAGWLMMGTARSAFGFFAGVALFRLFVRRKRPVPALNPIFGGAALLAIFCGPSDWFDIYNLAVAVLVFPLIVLSAAAYKPRRAGMWISKFAGWISFPLYALHMPVGQLAAGTLKHFALYNASAEPLRGAAIIVMVTATAILISLLYDEPVRRWLSAKSVDRITDRPLA